MMRPSTSQLRAVLVLLLAAFAGLSVHAQQDDTETLGARLRERYQVVSLDDGVGLVPRARDGIRIIEVRDGAVIVDGQELTGRELRERLGDDADLVLRVSYLDRAAQRELVGDGTQAAPSRDQVPDEPERRSSSGDLVRVMDNVTVPADERVDGDVVVVMGNAQIDGAVDGSVTVVMGNANLGPQSVIEGDLTLVGGALNRAEGARVEGSVEHVAAGSGRFRGNFPEQVRDTVLGRLGSLAGTLLRVALLTLLALVVVAFGRRSIEQIGARAAGDPLRAGLTGFAAQILFLPVLVITVVVLAVSIIGIPLLLLVPFAIVLLIVVLIVGFTGVAYEVGRVLNGRFGWEGRGPYASVLLGIVAIVLVTVLARSAAVMAGGWLTFPLSAVGYIVEYVAWTLGFGAAILAWLQKRRTPPPLPAT